MLLLLLTTNPDLVYNSLKRQQDLFIEQKKKSCKCTFIHYNFNFKQLIICILIVKILKTLKTSVSELKF